MEARHTKEGKIINAYILSIKNKSSDDILLTLGLGKGNEKSEFYPSLTDQLVISAGRVEKYPLFIRSNKNPAEDRMIEIVLSVSKDNARMTRSVFFLLPLKTKEIEKMAKKNQKSGGSI
jgi:hypothetical protein